MSGVGGVEFPGVVELRRRLAHWQLVLTLAAGAEVLIATAGHISRSPGFITAPWPPTKLGMCVPAANLGIVRVGCETDGWLTADVGAAARENSYFDAQGNLTPCTQAPIDGITLDMLPGVGSQVRFYVGARAAFWVTLA